MGATAHHLREVTINKLEAELADYNNTKRAISDTEIELAYPSGGGMDVLGVAIRPVGTVSDPTYNRATAMASNTLLNKMRAVVRAIDQVVLEQPEERRIWIQLRYWRLPRKSVEAAAEAANVDPRTTARWRREILSRLADVLGEW